MTPLRVLHLGVANRGLWPLRECNAASGFVPTALCDVNPGALAAARELTGLPASAAYSDLAEALTRDDLDCAIICAPTVLHFTLARQVMARGLPVLVEKGMAADWATARQFANFVREKNAVAVIAQNYRYRAIERTVWRAIHDATSSYHVG